MTYGLPPSYAESVMAKWFARIATVFTILITPPAQPAASARVLPP
jgi:hypothetical protein